MTKKSVLVNARELFMIAFGLLIFVVGWNIFLFPHQIAGGGASGIAVIIMYATKGVVEGGIPVSISFFAINAVLLIFSIKHLGLKFSLRSIWGVVCSTIWFAIPFVDVFNSIMTTPIPTFDPFMSSVMAGLFSGIGLGIAFNNNGSSGGTDIIAKIVNKYKPITLGRALLLCDVVIISTIGLLPEAGLEEVVYGMIEMFIATMVVDMYINGMRQSVQFFIFSSKYEAIADCIANELGRGVTILDGQGWYSKKPVKVITLLTRKTESTKVFRLVKNIDPNAFVSQSAAIGVYGEGFEPIGQN
ncbi:MAG: YitT family protein [bacterium]